MRAFLFALFAVSVVGQLIDPNGPPPSQEAPPGAEDIPLPGLPEKRSETFRHLFKRSEDNPEVNEAQDMFLERYALQHPEKRDEIEVERMRLRQAPE
jgi:hypothetical protein